MESIYKVNDFLNSIVWGPYMIALLVGTGIYLSIRFKFFQFTKFRHIMKNTFGKAFRKGDAEGDISSGQAGLTSIAAVVGTGNIAGVATAISLGGPGAVFWMWFAALFGMATKFTEITLGIKYRKKNRDGSYSGGPMYYIQKGLNNKWMAGFFSIMVIIAYFVVGAIVDTNTIVLSIEEQWGIRPVISGIVFAILSGIVIFGGIKKIGEVCERLTPIMGGIYIISGLAIIILNITKVPGAFKLIFKSAFTPISATGGFAGATVAQAMTLGTARGLFSNEAGVGGSPIIHSSAQVNHPIEQGIWGVAEVFFDTIIICTITALTIIISGEWMTGTEGVALTMRAFSTALGSDIGSYVVLISAILFGYSCLISANYYCEVAGRYLFGEKSVIPIRVLWVVFIVIGSVGGLEFVWDLADTANGLMAIPNLIAVILLSGQVLKLKNEYFEIRE
ncbi:sodium:alanine symporter family protein [Anaerosalibacter bizertensis]|uniref:Sodium:alanine symporter family protein n=2 Tax=Bacillota TaxID=1239 RepID=A0A9Q4AEC2_9FIRM|nr:sodium:alanine symporter family protein [Anaerosalibacter bizertensis]MBV1821184.1 sodium:alanine symporter family protein [Bacteroidales bacterium MSK.15.36]MCB5560640.1 sodium:alanine symporter family protein [Anaerosalibacter bizertensis]MCG4566101.1 sodium:alanine symporter family protein [Anaerosalibacter bizertensis]MCG4583576.1 sodium:alanine symporter family protein [Anaerosalibacter bizertensis]